MTNLVEVGNEPHKSNHDAVSGERFHVRNRCFSRRVLQGNMEAAALGFPMARMIAFKMFTDCGHCRFSDAEHLPPLDTVVVPGARNRETLGRERDKDLTQTRYRICNQRTAFSVSQPNARSSRPAIAQLEHLHCPRRPERTAGYHKQYFSVQ